METLPKEIDTVIVGAGQSALATSYCLKQHAISHLLLERDRIGEAWRSGKWDSFTMVSPNWSMQLPSFTYAGNDPDRYMTSEDVVRYLDNYVRLTNPPVHTGVNVTRLSGANGAFLVETSQGDIAARNVVVATGAFQKPRIPPCAANLDPHIAQLHSSEYRNPEHLSEGAVLVVGSGQSGCQIARELHRAGRKVYLSTGRAARLPRRYRGREVFRWVQEMGMFDRTVDKLESPAERFEANPQLTGREGGSSLNLHQFYLDGVTLLGRFQDADATTACFAPNLRENLAYADLVEREFKKAVDAYVDENALPAPEDHDNVPQLDAAYGAPPIHTLDLCAAGVTSIIWAAGYRCDFGWIDFPIFDEYGYPVHVRGVTAQPGLYFIGLLWLHTSKSNLFLGVGADAAHLAAHIAEAR